MAKSSAADDADDTLKRRARRRLIGAVALVLAAVIALPMIFDDEKRPLDQDVSIQIPSQDAYAVKPATPPAASTAPAKPKTVEPREPGTVERPKTDVSPQAGTSASQSPTEPVAKPDVAVAREPAKVESKPAAPEAKAPPAQATRVDAAKAPREVPPRPAAPEGASKGEAARVQAILDAKPSASGGFAVQVGAFAADDKVREAREKLSGAGIPTYTEKLETREGERTRVRAGPFGSRESAETARDRIRSLGFAGANVVAK